MPTEPIEPKESALEHMKKKNPNVIDLDPLGPLFGEIVEPPHDPKCATITACAPEDDPRCDCGADYEGIEGPPCKHPECGHGERRHELAPTAAADSPRGPCRVFDGADEDGCPCQAFEPFPLESEHAEEQAETIARSRE